MRSALYGALAAENCRGSTRLLLIQKHGGRSFVRVHVRVAINTYKNDNVNG